MQPEFSIAPFRFDVTPPLGHSLLAGWIPSAQVIDDSLEAIGYVLLGHGAPIVVCVVDWAALMNEAHVAWRTALAEAAGTTPERVAVQCVHQHNTPFVCPEARAIAAQYADLPLIYDADFFAACLERGRRAVADAIGRAERVTHVAHGQAVVKQVAANRRVDRDANGRVQEMRLSSCTDPKLIALPEGLIDRDLQTIAFYAGEKKIVSCHYYATHPMSFYRDGRVTSDFCGLARKRRQAEEPGCTHLYFTGCAGNVAAGKYNDGSAAARGQLIDRMYAALVESERGLKPEPLVSLQWRTEKLLPAPATGRSAAELAAAVADSKRSLVERLLPAFRLSWLRRTERGTPLVLSSLQVNDISILHLPGEMFIEYQLRARGYSQNPVAVAAYGDDGLWYVPTREEYSNGGYEVGVAFCSEEADAMFTGAIKRLLT
jgi:cytochrome c551/c552